LPLSGSVFVYAAFKVFSYNAIDNDVLYYCQHAYAVIWLVVSGLTC